MADDPHARLRRSTARGTLQTLIALTRRQERTAPDGRTGRQGVIADGRVDGSCLS